MTRAVSRVATGSGLIVLYAACVHLARSPLVARAPEAIAVGLTLDLAVTAPLIVYFLGVRPGHVPRWALLPVFLAGIATARAVVPGSEALVVALGVAWAAAELGLATLAVARLLRIVRRVRALRGEGAALVRSVEQALAEALGSARLASVLAVELGAFVYGLAGWFLRAPAGGFTVHRRRRWGVVAGVVAFLLVTETLAVHVALARLSPVAAWVATATSVYALVWLAGDAHALRLQPLRVAGGALHVDLGLRWRLSVPLADIATALPIDAAPDPAPDLLRADVLGPNVLIDLAAPIVASGPFGLVRRVRRIGLTLDEPQAFLDALARGA